MITIDATGKKLGRLASEVASHLTGKKTALFVRNKIVGDKVTIVNASKLDINARKKESKQYVTFTGFRGGLDTETLDHMITRKGYAEPLLRAITGMLPKNKLTKSVLKNLTIKE